MHTREERVDVEEVPDSHIALDELSVLETEALLKRTAAPSGGDSRGSLPKEHLRGSWELASWLSLLIN